MTKTKTRDAQDKDLISGHTTYMTSWFEFKNNNNGQYYFTIKTENSETALSSELYNTKNSAKNGLASVQLNSSLDDRYERKTAPNGRLYFNLKSSNHQIIGISPMYTSETAREEIIKNIKKNGLSMKIKDSTNDKT